MFVGWVQGCSGLTNWPQRVLFIVSFTILVPVCFLRLLFCPTHAAHKPPVVCKPRGSSGLRGPFLQHQQIGSNHLSDSFTCTGQVCPRPQDSDLTLKTCWAHRDHLSWTPLVLVDVWVSTQFLNESMLSITYMCVNSQPTADLSCDQTLWLDLLTICPTWWALRFDFSFCLFFFKEPFKQDVFGTVDVLANVQKVKMHVRF